MKLLKFALRRETVMPMLALGFASAVCLGLVFGRIVSTRNLRYSFLAWNLFLAWLPLVLALLAQRSFERERGRSWRFGALAVAWLLFFPNAPYIFTDLIHITARFSAHVWVDMMLILTCALTGLVLGFVSLYLMQGIVRRLLGGAASWLFIGGVAGLSGYGVWLGRFLRFNSWDVLVRPVSVYHGIGFWAANPFGRRASLVFPVLFGVFLFIAYLMLYALTHLRHAQPAPLASGSGNAINPKVPLPWGAASG